MPALDSALLGAVRASANKGRPYDIGAITTSRSLLPSECYGGVFTNEGASGAVTVTLPAAKVGMSVTALVMAAQTLIVDPNGSERHNFQGVRRAAGKYVSANAVGAYASLVCVEEGFWTSVDTNGTWTVET